MSTINETQTFRYHELKTVDARSRAIRESGSLVDLAVNNWKYNPSRIVQLILSLHFMDSGQIVNTQLF
jgi:hypothetical protein